MDALEDTEFGDWLNRERKRASKQASSKKTAVAAQSALRLQAVDTARTVLMEFLTLQDQMINAATAAQDAKQQARADLAQRRARAERRLAQ